MGIGIKIIDKNQMNDTVGYIAYPDEFENKPEIGDIPDFAEEFMLMCGLNSKVLDTVLNLMRKNKQSIALKAMLTETNQNWSLKKLINEITAERAMIARRKSY